MQDYVTTYLILGLIAPNTSPVGTYLSRQKLTPTLSDNHLNRSTAKKHFK